jgi:hypothetical protein
MTHSDPTRPLEPVMIAVGKVGEGTSQPGPEREESFVEHVHAFSSASLALLCTRAGFTLEQLERIREPITKYTLVAFLR